MEKVLVDVSQCPLRMFLGIWSSAVCIALTAYLLI